MTTLSIADIPSETVKRITVAADQLYEEGGRDAFPNVDAVRRKARVNMNDASNVMRAWRRAQTAGATTLTTSIPSAVQEASHAMLAAVWNAATTSANANLQTAQAGWEQERVEAEACRQQLAIAFDNQTEELAIAQRNASALEHKLAIQDAELLASSTSLENLRHELEKAEGRAATAEIRSIEIVKRADDLKTELARAHANADQERSDLKYRLVAADSTITQLRTELREAVERDIAIREDLARLHGQVEAMAIERQILLATPAPNSKGRKGNATSAPTVPPLRKTSS